MNLSSGVKSKPLKEFGSGVSGSCNIYIFEGNDLKMYFGSKILKNQEDFTAGELARVLLDFILKDPRLSR